MKEDSKGYKKEGLVNFRNRKIKKKGIHFKKGVSARSIFKKKGDEIAFFKQVISLGKI